MGMPVHQIGEPLHLYNSLSRGIDPFRPMSTTVMVSVCGITPYATTPLEHAFTYAWAMARRGRLAGHILDLVGRQLFVHEGEDRTDDRSALGRHKVQVGCHRAQEALEPVGGLVLDTGLRERTQHRLRRIMGRDTHQ